MGFPAPERIILRSDFDEAIRQRDDLVRKRDQLQQQLAASQAECADQRAQKEQYRTDWLSAQQQLTEAPSGRWQK